MSHVRQFAVACFLCVSAAWAQSPGTDHRIEQPEPPRVWFDDSEGAIWVRGTDFKASFGAGAATFIPFLGADSPRNFPVTFRLVALSAGEASLPLAPAVYGRAAERVIAERGPVREVYHVRPEAIEQTFVFDRPLAPGDIILRLDTASELVAAVTESGIEFANARGGVRYGRATAVDAAGRTAPMETRLEDGSIELVVPAEVAASATYPLTVDPVLLSFSASLAPSGIQHLNVDVAYDFLNDRYLIVFEDVYSATDHDISARAFDGNGVVVPGGTDWIDFTSTWWAKPKVASNNLADQFLVVAEKQVTIGGGFVTTEIWGRTRQAALPIAMGPQFQIGSAAFNAGALTHPDVGGDPGTVISPTYYCVVWQVWNGVIEYRMVTTQSTFASGWISLDSGGKSNPSISKSNGFLYPNYQEWIIVYQHTYSPTDEDIVAARIAPNGSVVAYPFWVDTSTASDDHPCVSSLTDFLPGVPGTGNAWMVAYERTIGNDEHVYGRVMSGSNPLVTVNLSGLLGATAPFQQMPCLDSDGIRFALGYSEHCGIFCQDALPYVATLHLENGGYGVGVSEGPQLLNGYAGQDLQLRVSSNRSGAGNRTRYLVGWHTLSTVGSDSFAHGAIYDGHSSSAPGPANWFNYAVPGCGALTLTMSGRPALGETIFANLSGVTGLPVFLVGPVLPPISVCGQCQVITDPFTATIITGVSSVADIVPMLGDLVDAQIAIQGADIGGVGGCPGPAFTLSPGVIITIL